MPATARAKPAERGLCSPYTNADLDALNRDIRALRKERGDLSGDHILKTKDGLQDRPAIVITKLLLLLGATRRWLVAISAWHPLTADVRWLPSPITTTSNPSAATTYTTG